MSQTACAHCAKPLNGAPMAHPRCGAEVHAGCIAAHMSTCVSNVQSSEATRTGAFAVLARREGPFCKACDEVFEPVGLETHCNLCRPKVAAVGRRKRKRSGWFSWLAA